MSAEFTPRPPAWDGPFLHVLAKSGDLTQVKLLLEKEEINVNSLDLDGRTPLSHAAENGHEAVIRLLLRKDGIDINFPDSDGGTPLHYAAKRGRETVTKLLLEKRAIKINYLDSEGRTPLHSAAEGGHEAVVRLLLEKEEININSPDSDGSTPLYYAAHGGHKAVVRLLLKENGIDVSSPGSGGSTPLHCAAKQGEEAIVQLLLEKGGIDVNAPNSSGSTPLHEAAQEGCEAVVKLLLKREEIDVNARDYNGRTPLHHAVQLRRVENRRQKRGYLEPLKYSWLRDAGEKRCVAVVKLLLKMAAININAPDSEGRTPLYCAVENECQIVVNLLVGGDEDGLSSGIAYARALRWAVEQGDEKLVTLLFEERVADLNHIITHSQTLLQLAIKKGNSKIVRELICHGADVNCEDKTGTTALRLALCFERPDITDFLIGNSAHTKATTAKEWRKAYRKEDSDILILTEKQGKQNVRFVAERNIQDILTQAPTISERRLFLFADSLSWQKSLLPDHKNTLQLSSSAIYYRETSKDSGITCCLAGLFPKGQEKEDHKIFNLSDWDECGIAWTMLPPTNPPNDRQWKSIEHFSVLPYAWIPDDSLDSFTQFIHHLEERWLKLCDSADEHLSRRRLEQLRAKGKSLTVINHLADDALDLAELRKSLRGQVQTAKKVAVDHCQQYAKDRSVNIVETISVFSDNVNNQIDNLDQTIRDLLQLEFAWGSINEAHRSTSIARSMKRLSWINFIFLPAMFASSVFGMNVDILKDNPDWRWYILFGGTILMVTLAGWLLFKYSPVESWVESNVDHIRQRVGKLNRRKKPSKGSPV